MTPQSARIIPITTALQVLESPHDAEPASRSGLPRGVDPFEEEAGGRGHLIELQREGRPVASVRVLRAEHSAAQSRHEVPSAGLDKAIYLCDLRLAADASAESTLPVLLYAAMRRGRLWGRTQVALSVREGSPVERVLPLEPVPLARELDGPDGSRFPLLAQRIDYGMQRAFEAARSRDLAIAPSFLVDELGVRLDAYTSDIWQSKFYVATMNRTLGRAQYVYVLSNMYQFVRFTTRILGHAVSQSPTTELRTHFVRHLRGEVNHELIIERDLATLGADVDYVRDRMAPNPCIRQFMSAQESAVAFHHDPILLMAAPLAAEVLAARLPSDYVDALHDCVRAWGVSDPRKATMFITSHVHTDGSEDGHLAGTLAALGPCFTSEVKLQSFISVLDVCMDAFRRGYDVMMEDVGLWSSAPGQARRAGDSVAAE
jgi:thiaminase